MKLQKLVLSLVSIVGTMTSSIAQSSNAYHIKGYLPNVERVYFRPNGFSSLEKDSVLTKDGHFEFKGIAENVTEGILSTYTNKGKFDMYNVFVEPGTINVNYYPENGSVAATGTRDNNLSKDFFFNQPYYINKHISNLYDSVNMLSEKLSYLRDDSTASKESIRALENAKSKYEQEIYPQSKRFFKALEDYIYTQPNSYFSLSRAISHFEFMSTDSIKHIYNGLSAALKTSPMGLELKSKIDRVVIAAVNTPAPLFSSIDVNNKKIALTSFKGKYVLLDFWATWCSPCRAGNPELIKLYNEYHPKGLEIIGISDDDQNINGWKAAIRKDEIGIWNHILRTVNNKDAKGKAMDLSKAYNVPSYPTKILIDKKGIIIGRYQNDDELKSKLAQLMN